MIYYLLLLDDFYIYKKKLHAFSRHTRNDDRTTVVSYMMTFWARYGTMADTHAHTHTAVCYAKGPPGACVYSIRARVVRVCSCALNIT